MQPVRRGSLNEETLVASSNPDRWRVPATAHRTDADALCRGESLPARAAAPPRLNVRAPGPRLVADNPGPELQLSRVVELEIIPRLMLLHGGIAVTAPPPPRAFAISAAHVETLTRLVVDPDPQRATDFVVALASAGAPRQEVLLHLLVPSARLLGKLWLDDVYDFSQVTIGLWRLQRVLHDEALRLRVPGTPRGGRALLAVVPGAQHTFGVSVLGEFFERDGWVVDFDPQARWSDLEQQLAEHSYDMVGVSISMDETVPLVASAILGLRKASRSRSLYVMVGGPAALNQPDLALRCGADAMAMEAPEALALANRRLAAVHRVRAT